MVGGLFLCLGMFGFGIHIYRRYVLPRTSSGHRRLQVLERIQISQKSALVLVKLDNKEFIMSTGSESSRLVPLTGRHEELFDEALSGACEEVGEYNA
jgi:flagellar biogenesis protein FliO